MPINVLRWGHRKERDKRVSTHAALVARAFGASELVYSGERDEGLENSVEAVVQNWGGPFRIRWISNPIAELKKAKARGAKIVHLTMYGLSLPEGIGFARRAKNLWIVIGAEKMPPEVYRIADWNVSITNQPHSEVGALAVFLHELAGGKELLRKFRGARLQIRPSLRGKIVEERSKSRRKTG